MSNRDSLDADLDRWQDEQDEDYVSPEDIARDRAEYLPKKIGGTIMKFILTLKKELKAIRSLHETDALKRVMNKARRIRTAFARFKTLLLPILVCRISKNGLED